MDAVSKEATEPVRVTEISSWQTARAALAFPVVRSRDLSFDAANEQAQAVLGELEAASSTVVGVAKWDEEQLENGRRRTVPTGLVLSSCGLFIEVDYGRGGVRICGRDLKGSTSHFEWDGRDRWHLAVAFADGNQFSLFAQDVTPGSMVNRRSVRKLFDALLRVPTGT